MGSDTVLQQVCDLLRSSGARIGAIALLFSPRLFPPRLGGSSRPFPAVFYSPAWIVYVPPYVCTEYRMVHRLLCTVD